MSQAGLHQSSSDVPSPWLQIRELGRKFMALMDTWQSRARQRRDLREMEPRALQDVGISRADAVAEAAKPFWRP